MMRWILFIVAAVDVVLTANAAFHQDFAKASFWLLGAFWCFHLLEDKK